MLEMMMARGGPNAAPPPQRPEPAEKPFILRIQDKAELQRIYKEMVFQYPFALPTMSIEEAAEIEMEQARYQQERKAAAERQQIAEEQDRWYNGDRYGSKEEEEDERNIYKARDWDDWKDEHPWGSGNKMGNLG